MSLVRIASAAAGVALSAACISVDPPPPYDPGFVARVTAGAPASQVRSVLGRPRSAMPAVTPLPDALAKLYPGCATVSEEWEYAFAGCDVKVIFDEQGMMCSTKPVGPCGRRGP